ncbi:hypothetical protein FHT07_000503 [Xanthomonas arboricola]|nr:hypothetical protein [Xanthomonas arboricola]
MSITEDPCAPMRASHHPAYVIAIGTRTRA